MLFVDNWATHVSAVNLYYSLSHIDGSFYSSSKYGNGNLQFIFWSYNCAGSESSCLNPSYDYYVQSCYNGRTAGVKCYSKRIYRHTCTCILL